MTRMTSNFCRCPKSVCIASYFLWCGFVLWQLSAISDSYEKEEIDKSVLSCHIFNTVQHELNEAMRVHLNKRWANCNWTQPAVCMNPFLAPSCDFIIMEQQRTVWCDRLAAEAVSNPALSKKPQVWINSSTWNNAYQSRHDSKGQDDVNTFALRPSQSAVLWCAAGECVIFLQPQKRGCMPARQFERCQNHSRTRNVSALHDNAAHWMLMSECQNRFQMQVCFF